MKKNRKNSREMGQLEKKLAAYTFAGAAALAGTGAARADIVYVPNVNDQVTLGNLVTFQGITLSAQIEGPFDAVLANAASNAAVLLDGPVGDNVAALAFGAIIDPTTDATHWSSSGKLASSDSSEAGDWSSSGGTAFLGFYFGAAGSPQAGWAQIATTANSGTASFELLSYAYETDPDVAIAAGQTPPTVTPEPSALPLLVLGGAGLLALRRRRAANA
jgi:hypothetical protein